MPSALARATAPFPTSPCKSCAPTYAAGSSPMASCACTATRAGTTVSSPSRASAAASAPPVEGAAWPRAAKPCLAAMRLRSFASPRHRRPSGRPRLARGPHPPMGPHPPVCAPLPRASDAGLRLRTSGSPRCAYDAKLTSDVLRAFVRALFAELRRRVRRQREPSAQPSASQCGSVTFLQRFATELCSVAHRALCALAAPR